MFIAESCERAKTLVALVWYGRMKRRLIDTLAVQTYFSSVAVRFAPALPITASRYSC